MLNVRALNAYYGKSHIVRELSFELKPGTVVGLLGRNGVGKTTALRALMGLVKRQGDVTLDGRPIGTLPPNRVSIAGLGYVPQGRLLFPHLTVEENLRLSWHGTRFGTDELARGIDHFPPLKEMLTRKAGTLSGGEQQMVAIGRALLNSPKAILMDEPSEGLSPLFVERVGAIVDQIKRAKVAVLLVEQSLQLAIGACDEICFMEKGAIVNSCTPHSSHLQEMLERYLGVSTAEEPSKIVPQRNTGARK
jgi:branched-chain amino acid transport system ATP-binding protein